VFFPYEVPPEGRVIVILILREILYSGIIIYLAWLFLFLFVFSIFFRGYYPTPTRIWFIVIMANKGQTYNISVNFCIYIYYKLS
jgi:hypothetical protein